jgi:hypothetical protein
MRAKTKSAAHVVAVIEFGGLSTMPIRRKCGQGYAADWVLLALVSKSIWVAKAVCNLVQGGYPEEAFGLTRTLTDIFFTVRYICNKDSDRRARQYANYFAKRAGNVAQDKKFLFPE